MRRRHQSFRKACHRKPPSRGVAVVELAVCLPIIVLLLLGTVEACRMIQLKQNIMVAAYEGARVGIVPGSTSQSIDLQCGMLLDDRHIDGYSIDVSADPATLNRGDPLTVTVHADCEANALVGAIFYQGKTLSESVVMLVE